MKKSVKIVLTVVILLAIAAGSVYYMLQPVAVRMTELYFHTAELSFTEQGVVVAENTVLVFPTMTGEINALYVREGQEVAAGETILSVNTTATILQKSQVESGIRALYAQLANIEAENTRFRRTLEANRTSLQGELAAINAQASEAQRTLYNHHNVQDEQLRVQEILVEQHRREVMQLFEQFERILLLYESGVVARTEYETAQAAKTAAQARLEAAQGQLAIIAAQPAASTAEHFYGIRESLVAQINGITAQLASDTLSAAQENIEALISIEQANIVRLEHELANARITAPISGTITNLPARATNFISAAAPVAEITSYGNLYIASYVSTQDTDSIATGDEVMITLRRRTGDVIFPGTVLEIGTGATVRFTALGVEERKVRVRISIADGTTIGTGYGVDVTFFVHREENALVVPRTAIFRDGASYMVWVDENGTARPRQVTPGLELRTQTIISHGLSPGEFVINDANNRDISNGTRVMRE